MRVHTITLGALATNCYLIESPSGNVLIDPAEASPRLHDFVRDRKVDWVVNTHGHFDHIGGDWDFPEATVCLHEADLPYMDHAHPDHPPVGRYLSEGDEVIPGLSVLHTPGHSPGSIVLIGESALFSGDLLFYGSIGRTDFPGGSPREMTASLKRMLDLPGEYVIYPGHGETTTLERERAANPFLRNLR